MMSTMHRRSAWTVNVEMVGASPLGDDEVENLIEQLDRYRLGGVSTRDDIGWMSATIIVRAPSIAEAANDAVNAIAGALPGAWTPTVAEMRLIRDAPPSARPSVAPHVRKPSLVRDEVRARHGLGAE
jgi:hypothetical protein